MTAEVKKKGRTTVFRPICDAIAAHAELTARLQQTVAALSALASLIVAGITLIRSETDPLEQMAMLGCAVETHSVELVSAFPPRPSNTLRIAAHNHPTLARKASPEFLEALHKAGCNLGGFHTALAFRAIRRCDTELQGFLLSHVNTMYQDYDELLRKIKARDCAASPDFVATYVKAIVEAHPARVETAITNALARYKGLEFSLLYHAGARPAFDRLRGATQGARDTFDAISRHDFIQFIADGADLAAFCRNEEAQSRAIQMLSDKPVAA